MSLDVLVVNLRNRQTETYRNVYSGLCWGLTQASVPQENSLLPPVELFSRLSTYNQDNQDAYPDMSGEEPMLEEFSDEEMPNIYENGYNENGHETDISETDTVLEENPSTSAEQQERFINLEINPVAISVIRYSAGPVFENGFNSYYFERQPNCCRNLNNFTIPNENTASSIQPSTSDQWVTNNGDETMEVELTDETEVTENPEIPNPGVNQLPSSSTNFKRSISIEPHENLPIKKRRLNPEVICHTDTNHENIEVSVKSESMESKGISSKIMDINFLPIKERLKRRLVDVPNQVVQVVQIDQHDQVDQVDQVDQFDQVDQVDKVDKINKINEVDQGTSTSVNNPSPPPMQRELRRSTRRSVATPLYASWKNESTRSSSKRIKKR